MNKKKILFAINTLSKAGAETAFLCLLRSFSPEEYDIDVYVMLDQGELALSLGENARLLNKRYDTSSVLTAEGQRFLKKTCIRALFKRGNIFRFFGYLVKNYAAMKKQGRVQKDKLLWQIIASAADRIDTEYDLAVAYIEGASTYYVADYVQAKSKVAFLHIDYQVAGYTRQLDREAYLSFDHIFTVSDQGRASFGKAYPECATRATLFRNPIDGDLVKMMALEKGSVINKSASQDVIQLLTMARLHYQKGLDMAINAAAILRDRGISFQWHVLGDGALEAELRGQIDNIGLGEIFLLDGAIDNPYPSIYDCDIYVQPSRFEGRSVAIQEACVLGKCIIATKCSGNIEQLVDGEDGNLCEMDSESIAEAILKAIEDDELRRRLGDRAAKKPYIYEEDVELLKSYCK